LESLRFRFQRPWASHRMHKRPRNCKRVASPQGSCTRLGFAPSTAQPLLEPRQIPVPDYDNSHTFPPSWSLLHRRRSSYPRPLARLTVHNFATTLHYVLNKKTISHRRTLWRTLPDKETGQCQISVELLQHTLQLPSSAMSLPISAFANQICVQRKIQFNFLQSPQCFSRALMLISAIAIKSVSNRRYDPTSSSQCLDSLLWRLSSESKSVFDTRIYNSTSSCARSLDLMSITIATE
jgi:hypothetical protein